MKPEESYRSLRGSEIAHALNPDSPELFGVLDKLSVAILSGYKELQENIENGEIDRYSPTEYNDNRKKTKKREIEINLSWRNAEEANKKWKEKLMKIKQEKK